VDERNSKSVFHQTYNDRNVSWVTRKCVVDGSTIHFRSREQAQSKASVWNRKHRMSLQTKIGGRLVHWSFWT